MDLDVVMCKGASVWTGRAYEARPDLEAIEKGQSIKFDAITTLRGLRDYFAYQEECKTVFLLFDFALKYHTAKFNGSTKELPVGWSWLECSDLGCTNHALLPSNEPELSGENDDAFSYDVVDDWLGEYCESCIADLYDSVAEKQARPDKGRFTYQEAPLRRISLVTPLPSDGEERPTSVYLLLIAEPGHYLHEISKIGYSHCVPNRARNLREEYGLGFEIVAECEYPSEKRSQSGREVFA